MFIDILMGRGWPIVLGLSALLLALLFVFRQSERRKVLLVFVSLCLGGIALWIASALTRVGIAQGGNTLGEIATVVLGVMVIWIFGLTIFRLLLPIARLETPRILEDILVFVACVAWGVSRLRVHGLDVSSLVTTSAVITAVLAFSMQDTLGNILSGLALQLDNSLQLGQWVKISDWSGRVVQIGWRSTQVETRNGETVVVPNGWLMKNSYQIIGKRFPGGKPPQWRRWVWIEVSWDHPATKVLDILANAARESGITTMAAAPAPNAVLMELKGGIARYAVRYWLSDIAVDDPTDSLVRAHLVAALARDGIALCTNSHSIWMTQEDERTTAARQERELAKRLSALKGVSLFSSFTDDEMRALAAKLVLAPFEKGDIVSRQGAVAHWLYILTHGEVDVWLDYETADRQKLAHLAQGDFFGEMSLMTGAPRSATVVATTYAECYRLDSASFQAVIEARPELATELSAVLGQRQAQNTALPEGARPETHQPEILQRIRNFFRLSD